MSKKFNPYRSWLLIPEDQLPPDYYRLLGLRRFETDVSKINLAVEKRVAFLQDVSNGPHVNDAQRILGEVAKAGLCLKKPERRKKYDAKLREKLTREALQVELPEIVELPDPDEWIFSGAIPEAQLVQKRRKKRVVQPAPQPLPRSRKPVPKETESSNFVPVVIAANVLMIGLVAGGIYLFSQNQADPDEFVPMPTKTFAAPSPTKTIHTVEEDFESDVFASEEKKFVTEIGTLDLSTHAKLNNFDKNLRHLHILAGENRFVSLELNPQVAVPASFELYCELVKGEKNQNDNTLVVEVSDDGTEWQALERHTSSNFLLTRERNRNVPTPNRLVFWIESPTVKWIRIIGNTEQNPDGETEGGILIGKIKLSPISGQDRNAITY